MPDEEQAKAQAHEAEPQEARGAPGSRGMGTLPDEDPPTGRAKSGQKAHAADATGVNPLDPIDEDAPYLKPGDQGG
ncbi:hypothetical protein BH20ACT9_BH20ACT9_01030 [soil metagenome]